MCLLGKFSLSSEPWPLGSRCQGGSRSVPPHERRGEEQSKSNSGKRERLNSKQWESHKKLIDVGHL